MARKTQKSLPSAKVTIAAKPSPVDWLRLAVTIIFEIIRLFIHR